MKSENEITLTEEKVEILTIKDAEKWNAYLERLPLHQQDIYFTPEYYKLYENRSEGLAQCFIYEKKAALFIYPYLLNKIDRNKFKLDKDYFDISGVYGYNGVITNSNDALVTSTFFDAFKAHCIKNNIIAEFLRYHPLMQNHNNHSNLTKTIYDRNTIKIDLTRSLEDIWSNSYSTKNRNIIKNARNSGMRITIGHTTEDLRKFQELYHQTMRDLKADEYYYFDTAYFNDLMNLSPITISATLNNKIIGSVLLLKNGIYGHYHLSARDKDHSKLNVTHLLLDHAVSYLKNAGCHYFHLGGGRTNDPEDLLLKFKSSFSKNTCEFFIGKTIFNNTAFQTIREQFQNNYPEAFEKYKNQHLGYQKV